MKRTLNIVGRIAITATTVGAIGFAFVTLNPSEKDGEPSLDVQESKADIFSMSLADRTSTQKFQAALDRLGHEKPRVFDLNGNTVMFSTNQMRGSTDEVMHEYMQKFADEGVNPWVFGTEIEDGSPDHKKMLATGINGGVLPWVLQEDYASMGGGIVKVSVQGDDDLEDRVVEQNKKTEELLDRLEYGYKSCGGDAAALKAAMVNPREAETMAHKLKVEKTMTKLCEGNAAPAGQCDGIIYEQKQNAKRYSALVQVVEDQDLKECGPVRDAITAFAGMRYDDFTKRVVGFRSIEMWHNKKTNMNKITATWSDENFDMTKTQPSRYGGVIQNEAAKKIPLCPGCRRTWAFEGTGAEKAYSSNMIISPTDPGRTVAFYLQEMAKDGWAVPESDVVVEEMAKIHGGQDPNNRWVRFRRGNEHLAMNFERDQDGRTKVRTATAP